MTSIDYYRACVTVIEYTLFIAFKGTYKTLHELLDGDHL